MAKPRSVVQILNLLYRRFSTCVTLRRLRTRRTTQAPGRLQIGDTAQRGQAATKETPSPPSDGGEGWGEEAPLSVLCRTAPLLRPLPTPSAWGEEGENLLTPRRFRQILIEYNSALRLRPPFRIRLPSFVCLLSSVIRLRLRRAVFVVVVPIRADKAVRAPTHIRTRTVITATALLDKTV